MTQVHTTLFWCLVFCYNSESDRGQVLAVIWTNSALHTLIVRLFTIPANFCSARQQRKKNMLLCHHMSVVLHGNVSSIVPLCSTCYPLYCENNSSSRSQCCLHCSVFFNQPQSVLKFKGNPHREQFFKVDVSLSSISDMAQLNKKGINVISLNSSPGVLSAVQQQI